VGGFVKIRPNVLDQLAGVLQTAILKQRLCKPELRFWQIVLLASTRSNVDRPLERRDSKLGLSLYQVASPDSGLRAGFDPFPILDRPQNLQGLGKQAVSFIHPAHQKVKLRKRVVRTAVNRDAV